MIKINTNTLTIFTPTYNRAYTLPKLFESLEIQTNKDFIWLIVDDGSTDNTKEIVDSFKKVTTFMIHYIYKENGGKHTAHNLAVKNTNTELFYTVDSDDYLPSDTVEKIINIWNEVQSEELAGIIGLKAFSNGNVIGTYYPNNVKFAKLLDLYRIHGKKGDTSLIFATKVLKETTYPIFTGEKMIPDSYIYTKINQTKIMYVTNSILCYCEYLEDGLSANGTIKALKSPKGYAIDKKLMMQCEPTSKRRLMSMVGYVMYSTLSKDINNVIKDIGIIKTIASMPLALGMYLRLRYMAWKQKRRS